VNLANFVERRGCQSPRIGLAVELAIARDLDFQDLRQGVDHGHADAVQAARGLIDLRIEFSAGVQRRHDDFERRLVLVFGMGVDRNPATVVGDRQGAVRLQRDLDEIGVSGGRLVHRIVDDLGEEMMQRLLVGAADIHAGAAANRLQPFQHLDIGRRVFSGLR